MPEQSDIFAENSHQHMAEMGRKANEAAAQNRLIAYRRDLAANTLRRQAADLTLFARYLACTGSLTPAREEARWLDLDEAERAAWLDTKAGRAWLKQEGGILTTDLTRWAGLTWGLVERFVQWQLAQGYSVGSVNVRLATVRTYAELAHQAGVIDGQEARLIQSVKGKRPRHDHREVKRIGRKKARPVSLSREQAAELKQAPPPDTPQGRRDRLLLCLMLDHGLRCGEVAGLELTDLELSDGRLVFYRQKVDKTQTHRLSRDAYQAALSYVENDLPLAVDGPLVRGSRRNGSLTGQGMSVQKITGRVKLLGEQIGVEGLSAHDLRHHWATQAARAGTPLDRLQEAGGWSSAAIPLRYIEAARIANAGVKLE